MISASHLQILLGFDFGLRHIGVAIGQTLNRSARPLTVLRADQGAPDWSKIGNLLHEWQPDALIVGIPLHMDGSTQALTKASQRFADRLQGRFNLPVYGADERLTSMAAQEQLVSQGNYKPKQKSLIHAVSAQIILESWMLDQLPICNEDGE